MSAVDFDKLTAVNDEFRELEDNGELTQKEFDRLLKEAKKAVGDDTEFLEGILMRGFALGFVKR